MDLPNYKSKYLKYKQKYLQLQNEFIMMGGGKKLKKNTLKRNSNTTSNTTMSESELKSKPDYVETLSEPWFTLISMGLKTVEGRKNKGRFKEMKPGDIVEWTNDDFMPRSVKTRIVGKAKYNTFEEYLVSEGLDKCLPGMPDLEHGLSVYFKYFTKEDEKEFGVIAIRLELV